MPECRHQVICARNGGESTEEDLCILHSHNPGKDKQLFVKALEEHQKNKGHDFSFFVFPIKGDFHKAEFTKGACFANVKFTEGATFSWAKFSGHRGAKMFAGARFSGAEFTDRANFHEAEFSDGATFGRAIFTKGADFSSAKFTKDADFAGAEFRDGAAFQEALFTKGVNFGWTKFTKGADFAGAEFTGKSRFSRAEFLGRTLFVGKQPRMVVGRRLKDFKDKPLNVKIETAQIFANAEIDFTDALIEPLDAVIFRDADLRQCLFLGTDVRKAEFTDVRWSRVGLRFCVHDEFAPLGVLEIVRQYAKIEQLYRELKQNYEDRRDYERAGEFHFGEKVMRRRNPNTRWGLWFLLTLYSVFSGYGERYLRPLLWAGILLVSSAVLYFSLGLQPKSAVYQSSQDWITAFLYSLRVMTLFRADELANPLTVYGWVVVAVESILGPLFLGLFALAVRQRLKR